MACQLLYNRKNLQDWTHRFAHEYARVTWEESSAWPFEKLTLTLSAVTWERSSSDTLQLKHPLPEEHCGLFPLRDLILDDPEPFELPECRLPKSGDTAFFLKDSNIHGYSAMYSGLLQWASPTFQEFLTDQSTKRFSISCLSNHFKEVLLFG